MRESRVTFLYDASCGVCASLATWAERHDRKGRLLFVSNTPEVGQELGLAPTDLEREAWAIEPNGRKLSGAAAVNQVLEQLGGGWALLARAGRLPLMSWIEARVYRRFATTRNRPNPRAGS